MSNLPQNISEKRFRHRIRRLRKLQSRKTRTGSVRKTKPKTIFPYLLSTSLRQQLEDIIFYAQKFYGVGLKIRKRSDYIYKSKVPDHLSLLYATDNTLSFFKDICHSIIIRNFGGISLDHSKCKRIDFGASSILNAIIYILAESLDLEISGSLPEDPFAKEISSATGIHNLFQKKSRVQNLDYFPLTRGYDEKNNIKSSPKRDVVSFQFLSYIERCLKKYGSELSEEGRAYMLEAICEVLENAERHSSRSNWWISGYLQHETDGDGVLHMCIFNFGDTFYETLSSIDKRSVLRLRIEDFVRRHATRHLGASQLWTMYALQEGASRFQNDPISLNTSGKGMMKLINMFSELSSKDPNTPPEMIILSGETLIYFDMNSNTYDEKNSLEIIPFNNYQTLEHPPDVRNVRRVQESSPGAVISLRITLRTDQLKVNTHPFLKH